MRGVKPTPSAILRLRGSGKLRARRDEPTGPALEALPNPPTWFDGPARGKWAEIGGMLLQIGVLTGTDLDILRRYAVAFSRWQRAEKNLKEFGEVVTHKNGVDGQSHWLRVSETAQDRMDKSGGELGLSPVARTRLHVDARPASVACRDRGKQRFFGA